MRKMKLIVGLLVILSLALVPTAFAAKRDKFGADNRHEVEDGHAVVQRAAVL